MKYYHKLVRDRIPEIIADSGRKCRFTVLSESEYAIELDKKLNEEVAEYQESKSLEEIADVLEVIHAILNARGIPMETVEQIRTAKFQNRGGFSSRIMLEEVTETEE